MKNFALSINSSNDIHMLKTSQTENLGLSAFSNCDLSGGDPGGGAPVRNDVTIQDFSQEGLHL